MFSDPDSKVPEDAVKSLYNTYQEINKAGLYVGALGSTAYSEVTNLPYQINDCFIREIEELRVKEVSYTMNSISLIKTDLFKEVGLMDESLFIDGVDDEWCWRATNLFGCRFFLDSKVVINHNLDRYGGR